MPGTPEPIQPPMQRLITPERKLEALQHVNPARGSLGFLWDWAKIFTISVVLFFGIKTFLVEAFKIPSGSMERTLLVGDFLLVNKVVYGAELPLVSKRLPGIRRPTNPMSKCSRAMASACSIRLSIPSNSLSRSSTRDRRTWSGSVRSAIAIRRSCRRSCVAGL